MSPLSAVNRFREVSNSCREATAVVCGERAVTYGELDARSNALAARLTRDGSSTGPVGLIANRSIDMIVAVVAALKSGRGYVPLDPTYPVERLSYMLSNSGARLLLAHAAWRETVSGYLGEIWDLEAACGESSPGAADASLIRPVSPGLAYVIYTSGSTGTPKGVVMGQRALDHLVDWQLRNTEVLAGGRTLQFSPLSFDVSFQEIWSTLCSGGTLVLIDAETRLDSSRLREFLIRERVDRLFLPYVALQALAESAQAHAVPALQEVVTAGEQLVATPAIRRFFESIPDCRFYNHYGPSETHVVTAHLLRGSPSSWPQLPPIGSALDGTLLYVLDEARQPVPEGTVGELYVGGELLADGYSASPEMTAERFLADPFSEHGGRMYRTGDLVLKRENGDLEYLGRTDSQVKIRGFRVELGEVEAAIAQHPSVRQVAVTAFANPQADRPKRLVAYVTLDDSFKVNASVLRSHLIPLLPDYMLPSTFVFLQELPRTPSGKIDRRSLPPPDRKRPELNTPYVAAASELEKTVTGIWCELLELDRVGLDDDFFELGGTSLLALRFVRELAMRTGHEPGVAQLFDRTTPRALVSLLLGTHAKDYLGEAMARKRRSDGSRLEPIAIVGWAGRFPGAESIAELESLLRGGGEGVTFFRPEQLDARIPEALKQDPQYVAARGILPDPDRFDASLFGISPREAQVLDPQHRHLMELAFLALEDASVDSEAIDGEVGVFAGTMNNTYYSENVLKNPEALESFGAFNAMTANEKDYVATHISHRLNLRGPSVSVHTACSTSLVAVHLAAQSLRLRECDVALAGGASIGVPTAAGYVYNEGGMLSADGHCRSFDARATGTTFGDGGAVVVLKRLSDAVKDGDVIHATILGSAVNNDGAAKASFTAPSAEGQARVIAAALAAANVEPDSVGYVEAHGTATPIGDPIEVSALVKAYGTGKDAQPQCGLGSIKSNLGHLTAAAGVTGLIKAALSVRDGTLYPTAHFESLNPAIDLGGRFFVTTQLSSFLTQHTARRSAVSSMGVGGTNAHVILEQPPEPGLASASRPFQVILLSSHTQDGLRAHCQSLKQALSGGATPALADVAYTLATGRRPLRYRKALVAADIGELCLELDKVQRGVEATARGVAFVFPGQGTQYPQMAMGLYEAEPTFRAAFDQCCEAVNPELPIPLLDLLRGTAVDPEVAAQRLKETRFAQPALFAVEYSLAQLALSFGVKPVACIGHSVGEFVAATLAGVFRLEDAIRLVAVRGRAMQGMPAGGMLSVRESVDKVRGLLLPLTEIAAINGKSLVVVAGPVAALAELETRLQALEIACKPLHTSHAFHTWMMDGAVSIVREALSRVALKKPQLPFVSTATGTWIEDAEAINPDYWAQHLRRPVQFSQALRTLWSQNEPVLLELGPGATLPALARQSIDGQPLAITILGTARDSQPEPRLLIRSLGLMWEAGVGVNTASLFHKEQRRKVQLPARPLERQRFWLDPTVPESMALHTPDEKPQSPMQSNPTAPSARDRLVVEVRLLLESASGLSLANFDASTQFTEMGLDSLLLTQAALTFKKKFSVPVTFRQLSDDLSCLDALADYVLPRLPKERLAALAPPTPQAAAPAAASAVPVSAREASTSSPIARSVPDAGMSRPISPPPRMASGSDATQLLIQQQLYVMTRQLDLLQGVPVAEGRPEESVSPGAPVPEVSASPAVPAETVAARTPEPAATAASPPKTFGAQTRIDSTRREFDTAFLAKLHEFLGRYEAKTKGSKEYTAKHRSHLADPRAVSGFRPSVKEAIYPLVVERSKGCRLWDIDGNEYIDITCGFGTNFLGHSPDFITTAVKAQLDLGVEIGPQNPLAGEVTQLIAELTGLDRVALCNTGSEAVLGALRLARTVTGNSTVVMFTGAYHGIVDEVIVRAGAGLQSFPAAPGIPNEAVSNTLILDYGTPESLKIIRERACDLAAVLVEPVQSRHPDLQPREFLQELRKITQEAGVALIFDEVITGFRGCVGGAQQHFGVRADLATYGKIIGGGMPIGAIAGTRQFMDALDGGQWRYGDDSIPEIGVTYFAGTFVRHPLALAASKAALSFLKQQGPSLHERINAQTQRLVDGLNAHFAKSQAPVHIERFGSLFKIHVDEVHPLVAVFFHALRMRGLHVWEARPSFITYAHSDADVDAIAHAFHGACSDMSALGVFPQSQVRESAESPPVPGARLGRDERGNPAWFVPDPNRSGGYLKYLAS